MLLDPEDAGKTISTIKPKPSPWRWMIAAVTAIVSIAGAAFWYNQSTTDFEPASVDRIAYQLPDKPSIAVLPFSNLTGDSEQDYFVDGFTNEIITNLGAKDRFLVRSIPFSHATYYLTMA